MRNLSNLLNACAKFSLVAVLIAASFACGAVDWDEKQYNPKPAAGDVVLPMPGWYVPAGQALDAMLPAKQ